MVFQGELKRWQDPSTKEVFLIDSRSGHSFPASTKRTGGRGEENEGGAAEEQDEVQGGGGKRMSLKREGGCGEEKNRKEVPRWLESTLKVDPSLPSLHRFRSRLSKLTSVFLDTVTSELHQS